MVENAPILSCKHAGLTIEGYSRAAVQSYWRIPELKIGFDLGGQPWDFMGTPTWLVTHTHLDHIAALPVYVARRRMMKMEPPTIYLPEEGVEDVRKLLLIMHRLDFLERADRFKNELIICPHFSTRYHPQEVRKLLEAKLPTKLRARVKLWI